MRHVFLLALLLAVATPALASDERERREWQRSDSVLEATYAALHLVDWSQTLYIATRPPPPPGRPPPLWDGEANPILGRRPTRIGVHAYMAGTLAAHLTVSLLLPRPYRTVWQSVTIGVEAGVVGMNWTAGVRLGF